MKISINVNESIKETEIMVSCNKLTPDIEKLLAMLRVLNQQMMVMQDDEIHIIDVAKIVYIEAVDRKTFVYTEKCCYESKLKLYEMEERLCESGFFRVSKSCLVNVHFIRAIKNDINRKLRLTLENGELIMVSRQYAEEIKARLEAI
ncbi:MAG: LytTR family transcriptional regulator DNA-binding domain-containing protein [Lachnospira sp.]|nr:LytTR family transcriptional regulator DNA-binding domain-containing protein [Lachnospira sp.]